MANIALSEARVKALRPRPSTCDEPSVRISLIVPSACIALEAWQMARTGSNPASVPESTFVNCWDL